MIAQVTPSVTVTAREESLSARLASLPQRPPWYGARQVLRYNWPMYAAALCVAVGGGLVGGLPLGLPWWVRLGAVLSGAAAVLAAVLSILVTHHVYDRSPLHRWTWYHHEPSSWVVVHAGLDEASGPLHHLHPGSTGVSLDIYDPATMTEPSIKVARASSSSRTEALALPSIRADASHLPLPDASQDLVMLFFAIHELRQAAARAAFFQEVRRTLRPGGSASVVEHLRDGANALAYGPGVFHFLSRRQWLASFSTAGLRIVDEKRITPFVRCFTLEAR